MKLEGRKIFGFIIGMIVFVCMFAVLFLFGKEMLVSLGGYIIGSTLTLILAFMGYNSLDKVMKSVFYRKELDNEEEEP